MKKRIQLINVAFGLVVCMTPIICTGVRCASAPNVASAMPAKGSGILDQKRAPQQTLDPISQAIRSGYALLKDDKASEALDVFRGVLEIDKHNCNAMVGIALSHGSQGEWILACNELEEASLWNPRNPYALLTFLDVSHKQDRLNAAVLVVRRLCNGSDSGTADICQKVAEYLVEIDHWAAQWFAQRAHAINPKAYPSPDIYAKPLHLNLENTTYIGPDFTDLYPPSIPIPRITFSTFGDPAKNPYNRINMFGSSYGYGQTWQNVYGNIVTTPFDGSNLVYDSYPIGNGITYVPPYSGPIPR